MRAAFRRLASSGAASAPAPTPAPAAPAASRLFLNLVVERTFIVYPNDPSWRTEYETRAEHWREAYKLEYPKEFLKKLDPREAPRTSYLAAVERVLAQHADAQNEHDADTRSLKRKLDRRVYLLTSARGEWSFPRVEMSANDGSLSMRSAILALAREQLGPRLKVLHLSRAPIAHQAAADRLDLFFKLKHMVGDVEKGKGDAAALAWDDHAWLTREEAVEHLPAALRQLSSRMLLD